MLLSFDKPKKIRSTEEHNKMHSSEAPAAGTYVPNMSDEDNRKWKAKHIKGDDERIEIRKLLGGANILVKVFKRKLDNPYPDYPSFNDPNRAEKMDEYHKAHKAWGKNHDEVQFSTNGKINVSFEEWMELEKAVMEAKLILHTIPETI